jgi:biotin transport system substrate-specific component
MTTTTISSSTQVLADLFPRRDSRSRAITQDAVLVIGFALLTALAAQIEIPLGFTPVPLTGQTFAVLAVGSALGARRAMASQMLYWMLGAVGLPFYANGASGWSTASGATAGYFFGFILASGLVGWFADQRNDRNYVSSLSAMTLGSAIIYLCGALWLAHSLNIPVASGSKNAISMGVSPFLAGDVLKMALVAGVAPLAWATFGSRRQ